MEADKGKFILNVKSHSAVIQRVLLPFTLLFFLSLHRLHPPAHSTQSLHGGLRMDGGRREQLEGGGHLLSVGSVSYPLIETV